MAKNVTNAPEPEEAALADDAVVEIVAEVGDVTAAPPAAKRALGVKEPIIFKWKVVASTPGAVVTLYKSVEREEADAQAERLRKEDYYRDVRILEASAKVEQPVQKVVKKPTSRPEPAKGGAKTIEVAKKPARAVGPAKKTSRKGATKVTAKSARKKPASPSSAKRVAKSR